MVGRRERDQTSTDRARNGSVKERIDGWCSIGKCNAVQWSTEQLRCSIVQCSKVQYGAVHCSAVCAVRCSTVQCSAVLITTCCVSSLQSFHTSHVWHTTPLTALHCTALHCTALLLQYTALQFNALHYIALHCTALNWTALILHCTALHYDRNCTQNVSYVISHTVSHCRRTDKRPVFLFSFTCYPLFQYLLLTKNYLVLTESYN